MSKGKMKEAKEYLSRMKQLNKIIDRKEDRAAALYALALKTTPTMSDTGAMGGGNQEKMASAMDKYIDLKKEINDDINRLVVMQDEVYAILWQIKNQNYYDVLEKHYLQYKTFAQIGEEMERSVRWAIELHGRALEVFDKLMKEALCKTS